MLFKILQVSEANKLNHSFNKKQFYKIANSKDQSGLFQKLNSLPSGKKYTRYVLNNTIYFALGWNPKKNSSLFINVGMRKESIYSPYILDGGFKKIDKLILVEK